MRVGVICVDPGHGGSDPGAVGPSGAKEKDINLDIALRLKSLFDERGVLCMLTRDKDEDVELEPRCRIANNGAAEVFVSIHCNAAASRDAYGTEVYCFPGSTKGYQLAKCISNELLPIVPVMRGIKEAEFYVLKNTIMPAVLVEVGFISNYTEEKALQSEGYRQLLAEAVGKGVYAYFGMAWPTPKDKVKVIVKGKEISATLIDGKTWVPLRQLVEAMNYTVEWDEITRTATVK